MTKLRISQFTSISPGTPHDTAYEYRKWFADEGEIVATIDVLDVPSDEVLFYADITEWGEEDIDDCRLNMEFGIAGKYIKSAPDDVYSVREAIEYIAGLDAHAFLEELNEKRQS